MPRPRKKTPVKGIKRVTRRLADGSKAVYFYHRATGKALKSDPHTAAGLLEIERLDKRAAERSQAALSLHDLIQLFSGGGGREESADWKALSDRSQALYGADWRYLEAGAADIVADAMTQAEASKLIADARDVRGVRAAQLMRSHMLRLYDWGLERGHVTQNPFKETKNPKQPKTHKKRNRRLGMDELRAIFADAEGHPGYRALIALCMFGGLRVGDAAKARWDGIRGDRLTITAQKNAHQVEIVISGALADILARTPRTAATISTSARGTPWTKTGYDKAWQARRDRLEGAGLIRPGATFHGMRHTLASTGKEMGLTDAEVASIIGDKSAAMASTYARDADMTAVGARKREQISDALASQILPGLENGLENEGVVKIAKRKKAK